MKKSANAIFRTSLLEHLPHRALGVDARYEKYEKGGDTMKFIPELVDTIKKRLVSTRPIPPGQVVTIREDIEHVEHMVLQATCTEGKNEFKIQMDEPQERGGTGQYRTPLSYLVAGAGG